MLKRWLGKFAGTPSVATATDTGADLAARVDALYAEASAAWQRDEHSAAAAGAAAGLALDASLPALHYLHGSALFALGRNDEASAAMQRCLALRPAYPLVLNAETHAALARARADLERGIAPRDEPRYSGPPQRVSVIICSVTPQKFARVSASYSRLLEGVPHEIIGIHDARSMCQGYNRGLQRASGDLLVFSHDDIEILAPDFADRLRNRLQQYALVGVAGTTRLTGSGWIYERWPHMHGQVGMPRDDGGAGIIVTPYRMRGNATAGVQVMDGLLLACRRDVAELTFDAATFDGWHLYDFDFCYRAWQAGFATAVCHDFLVVHASKGSFGADWLRYAGDFMAKHRDTLGALESLSGNAPPQLASVLMRSATEWRLFSEQVGMRQE